MHRVKKCVRVQMCVTHTHTSLFVYGCVCAREVYLSHTHTSLSLTHTHLSLSHTHTHLCLSNTHTHLSFSHTHTHLCLSHTHTRMQPHSLALSFSRSLSHSHTLTLSLSHPLSLSVAQALWGLFIYSSAAILGALICNCMLHATSTMVWPVAIRSVCILLSEYFFSVTVGGACLIVVLSGFLLK